MTRVIATEFLSVLTSSVRAVPSSLHDALVEMFRQHPDVVSAFLADSLAIKVPPHDGAAFKSADSSPLTAVEYRADGVVVLSQADAEVLAVVVEVQLRRDPAKQWTWPIYLATLRGRYRCPAVLLVVCVDAATAAWCAAPISLGPGSMVTPAVLGPERVPVVTDPAEAGRVPELAVLSALAHGGGPERQNVLKALLIALNEVDPRPRHPVL